MIVVYKASSINVTTSFRTADCSFKLNVTNTGCLVIHEKEMENHNPSFFEK